MPSKVASERTSGADDGFQMETGREALSIKIEHSVARQDEEEEDDEENPTTSEMDSGNEFAAIQRVFTGMWTLNHAREQSSMTNDHRP